MQIICDHPVLRTGHIMLSVTKNNLYPAVTFQKNLEKRINMHYKKIADALWCLSTAAGSMQSVNSQCHIDFKTLRS